MNKFKDFVGIDISKNTFDVFLMKDGKKSSSSFSQFENQKKGFAKFLQWLKKQKVNCTDTLFCMEFTGIYNYSLAQFIQEQGGHLWIEMALKIIRSMGIQRGKNDRIDAERITLFAMKNQADFVPFQVHRKPILIIKQLLNARAILLGTRVKLLVQIKELERIDKLLANEIKVNLKKSLLALATDIKKIEGRIKKIIQEDEAVKKLHDLILTVPGVGLITFCYLLYFTNEFKQYSGAKQLACYCGVVPFEHTSGTSVKGKPRVHSMANKHMKKLLHTAALSTIIYYDEFKNYYKRKQAEGKNNMLILNNIRNKIVLRIAAVIKNQKPYQAQIVG